MTIEQLAIRRFLDRMNGSDVGMIKGRSRLGFLQETSSRDAGGTGLRR